MKGGMWSWERKGCGHGEGVAWMEGDGIRNKKSNGKRIIYIIVIYGNNYMGWGWGMLVGGRGS
jgi:hypothetical protein